MTMPDQKPTPGPWTARLLTQTRMEDGTLVILTDQPVKKWTISHVDRDDRGRRRTRFVADVYATTGFESEMVPNAHLIAAAPCLRDALVTLADICDRSFAPSHAALEKGSSAWVEGRQLRDAIDAAHAALSQANGAPHDRA